MSAASVKQNWQGLEGSKPSGG